LRGLDAVRPIGNDAGMTKVDERAHVPPVDEAARERLAAALDRDGVVAAMLIGSQARGEAHPLSDVDIAVWHEPDLDPSRRLRLQLDLIAAAEAALGTDQVDVVMLNRAPPLLRHRAIGEGIRLVERDREERVRLETRAILDFLDTERLRAEQGRGLRRRIAEGRYGRRPSS
jgi:predicted nucleotidyltransferase